LRADRNDAQVEEFAMPLGDHLEELRRRLLWSVVVVGVAFIAAWAFRGAIMQFLVRPHVLAMKAVQLEPTLKFSTYLEPVTAQLKACLLAALVVASPLVLYQVWAFVAPGLYKREQRFVLRVGLISLGCFALGAGFGYFLFIPLVLRFLLALSGAQTEPVLMIGPYLSLLLLLTLALGAVFQTPLVMYYLVRWGVVSVEAIQRHRKLAILAAFAVPAVLPPPDPFTQLMMAVPVVVLYDIGALIAAPSRRAVLNFFASAGTVGLIVVLIGGFFFLWPVGRLSALRPTVQVGSQQIGPGQILTLRRGQTCRVGPEGLARIGLGSGERAPYILLAGATTAQAHGRGSVTLYEGRLLADNSSSGPIIEVRASAGRITLQQGKADFAAPEPDTLMVRVLAGEAHARVDGRTLTITKGRSATFHKGGEPVDASRIEQWWESYLGTGRGSGD